MPALFRTVDPTEIVAYTGSIGRQRDLLRRNRPCGDDSSNEVSALGLLLVVSVGCDDIRTLTAVLRCRENHRRNHQCARSAGSASGLPRGAKVVLAGLESAAA
jgi:hypothetical protein